MGASPSATPTSAAATTPSTQSDSSTDTWSQTA
jgi:hypothetical protein